VTEPSIFTILLPRDRDKLVERALSQLISVFGPSIVPTIYDNLERISKEENDELKRKVDKARR
jgi:hypothetical protein